MLEPRKDIKISDYWLDCVIKYLVKYNRQKELVKLITTMVQNNKIKTFLAIMSLDKVNRCLSTDQKKVNIF